MRIESNHDEDAYLKRATFIVYLCIQTAIVAGFIMADHVRIGYVEAGLLDLKMDLKNKFDASALDRADLRKDINNTAQFSYRLDNIQKDLSSIASNLTEHLKETKNGHKEQ